MKEWKPFMADSGKHWAALRRISGPSRRGLIFAAPVLGLSLLALSSCAKRGTLPPAPDEPESDAAGILERATWVFHPLKKAPRTDTVELPSGTLEVDEAGSRWLHGAGLPAVSPFGAPEPLSAILPLKGQVAVVGKSGTVYVAEEALGPFVEVRSPDRPFAVTRRAGKILVAVSQEGAIHRSEDAGLNWSLGDDSARFVDVAPNNDGSIVAYSVPEQWYRSKDQGRSFAKMQVPSVAPRELSVSPEGALIAHGFLAEQVLSASGFQPISTPLAAPQEESGRYVLPTYGRGSVIHARHASLSGDKYLSLYGLGTRWHAQAGALGEPLEKLDVQGLPACSEFRMAASGQHVFVVCQKPSPLGVSPLMDLFRSGDGGKTFSKVAGLFRGALPLLDVSVSSDGKAAVMGLCPQTKPERGCTVAGIQWFLGGKEIKHLHLPGIPNPYELSFDEGGRLWVMGRRDKDGHALLFGPIASVDADITLRDLSVEARFPVLAPERATTRMDLLPGVGGLVSVVLKVMDQSSVATFDERGELLGIGKSPAGDLTIVGAGARLIGVSSTSDVLWESSTGGLSWEKQSLPRKLCEGDKRGCEVHPSCSPAGCLLGDELTRQGWGSAGPSLSTPAPLDVPRSSDQAQAPGFLCQAGSEDWAVLRGLLRVPEAADAMLGTAAWVELQSFPEQAAATSVRAEIGRRELLREVLLAPVADPAAYIFKAAPQVEGSAVARFRFPKPSKGAHVDFGYSKLPVDVAWDNRIESLASQVSFEALVQLGPSSFFGRVLSSGDDGHYLSVAGRGLYVRLTPAENNAPTYFVTGSGKNFVSEEVAPVRWPNFANQEDGWIRDATLLSMMREERVEVEDGHGALLMFGGGRVMLSAEGLQQNGTNLSARPYLLGIFGANAERYAQSVSLAYQGKRVGFVSTHVALDGSHHRAAFIGVGEGGRFLPPINVPLQEDLKGALVPCSSEVRKSTPRVVASKPPNQSRSVAVQLSEKETVRLFTDDAVLFGTPEQPCVGALDALPARTASRGGIVYSALLIPGDVSWVFRIESSPHAASVVSAKPMQCSPD